MTDPERPPVDPLREALDAVFDSLFAAVVAEMKVVGDSYGEEGMIANRAVAQAFRYYASSWLADRIKKAHQEARAALASPAAPRPEGPYTVRKIEDTADDWWDVLDVDGEKVALCGEDDARQIAAALNHMSDHLRQAFADARLSDTGDTP